MRTFTAHSDGRILVPHKRVKLRRGGQYRVTLEPVREADEKGFPLLDLAIRLSKQMKGNYPTDLARNHDHYLHGRPKPR